MEGARGARGGGRGSHWTGAGLGRSVQHQDLSGTQETRGGHEADADSSCDRFEPPSGSIRGLRELLSGCELPVQNQWTQFNA